VTTSNLIGEDFNLDVVVVEVIDEDEKEDEDMGGRGNM